jgi:serine/threonine protein kinase
MFTNLLKNVSRASNDDEDDEMMIHPSIRLPNNPSTKQIQEATLEALEEYVKRDISNIHSETAQEYIRRLQIIDEEEQFDDDDVTDEERPVTRDEFEQGIFEMLSKPPTAAPKINRNHFNIKGTVFRLPERYSNLDKVLGEGAYGVVVRAHDSVTDRHVAVKKITDVFEKEEEYQKRILREVMITKHLRGHRNIVQMIDLPPPESMSDFDDVYIVLECMGWNLNDLLRSNNELNEATIKYFMHNLLSGLKYIHSAGVVHRDLKPSNILMNQEMDIRICDFGLARWLDFDQLDRTMYVVSRWYRAPELLLMYENSSLPVDVWSIGLIFAELLMPTGHRVPLLKGTNYLDQVEITMKFCGSQRDEDLFGCTKGLEYVKGRYSNLPKTNLRSIFPTVSNEAIDLLEKMLEFNPHKRITAAQALEHPFLKDLNEGDDEPCEEMRFWFDTKSMGPHFKRILYEEVVTNYDEFQTNPFEYDDEEEEEGEDTEMNDS